MKSLRILTTALIATILLSTCEQYEELIEPEQPLSRIQEVSLEEDLHLQNLVNGINDQFNINGRTNSLLYRVDFSQATKLYDSVNHATKYTFSMIEEEVYSLQNFILTEPDQGQIFGLVFTHALDLDWYAQYDSFPGWDRFKGTFTIQDLEGNLIAENQIMDGSSIRENIQSGRTSGTTCVTEYTLITETYDVYVNGAYSYTEVANEYIITETTCYDSGGGISSADSPNGQISEEQDYVRGGSDFPPLGNNCGENSTYNEETETCECNDGYEKDGNDNCVEMDKSPCEFIDELGSNQGFNDKMNILKASTSGNFEKGYVMHSPSNGNYQYSYIEGNANNPEIEFNVQGRVDGYIHSHYNGTLSIFSGSDIRALYVMYANNHIRDIDEFSIGVTTSQGTSYILMIDNPVSFQNFGDQYLKENLAFEWVFEPSYVNNYDIKPSNSSTKNELNFLKLLSDYSSGLLLFKQNENDWIQIKSRNNEVININCN